MQIPSRPQCTRIRTALLILSGAFGIMTGAAGLNALLRSNGTKEGYVSAAPLGVDVVINVRDVFIPGAVTSSAATFIFGIACLSLLIPRFWGWNPVKSKGPGATERESGDSPPSSTVDSATGQTTTPRSRRDDRRVASSVPGRVRPTHKALIIESTLLVIATLMLLVSSAIYTHETRVGHAKVTAFVGGIQIGQPLVDGFIKDQGISTAYRDISYLRMLQITPWFTILFTLLTVIVSVLIIVRDTASGKKALLPSLSTSASGGTEMEGKAV